ncbi:response regulator [bacterium]|nr:response regulator [bacterium]
MKKKIDILLLVHHETEAVRIEKEIRSAGLSFTITRAAGESDLIDRLKANIPDVLLSSHFLPQINGLDIVRLVRNQSPDIPIILISGSIDEETTAECLKAGASEIIKDRLSRLGPAIIAAVAKKKSDHDKRTAQEALDSSEAQYRRLFESAREGILVLDLKESKITDANPYMLTLLGCRPEAVLGKTLFEIGLFKERKEYEDAFDTLQKQGFLVVDELILNQPQGKSIIAEMSCNTYRVGLRMVAQCNVHDITERKNAEAEREKISAQLFQAQKMEAIGTLAGGVAHDFNNLMTAIQVSADVAMMKISEEDALYKDFKEIRLAALKASGLIRQLLLFSREHPMAFQAIDLDEVIETLLRMLKRLIGEDIKIQTRLDCRDWSVQADMTNMEQVLMNLVLNARDAMPKGGRLMIHTKPILFDEESCSAMPEAKPGQYVCLSIIDTGVGMDRPTLERIFEPFFTTKPPGRGTGLGLAVVYGIVKMHKGWIHVDSSPGHGSAFQVYLPAASEKSSEKSEKKVAIQELHGRGQKILLVEDEDKVREFTAKALEKCGYSVLVAGNVSEALNVFRNQKGDFDLVFSDVVLSDRTGIDLADEVSSLSPKMNILLCSGYMDHKSQWPLIRQKNYRYIQKPYALAELLRAVKDAIRP